NGARCAALHAAQRRLQATSSKLQAKKIEIETKAGIIEAEIKKVTSHQSPVTSQKIKVKMPQPKNFKADIPLKIGNKTILVNFVEVGVPHSVIFVENLEKIDVQNLGKEIRCHQKFQPQGTNVNFVKVVDKNNFQIRTYERGVEKETLSCGTGSTASAIIAYRKSLIAENEVNVHTQGEVLKVYFEKQLKNVYLEGEAKIVYEGKYEI
ncbi:MAG: diaminopimelate epimerase, partial [Candidatus Omnitrophica bacterium]|nr:diaminopimelate epimerase [Candidatus Omnitrophota bacterium]